MELKIARLESQVEALRDGGRQRTTRRSTISTTGLCLVSLPVPLKRHLATYGVKVALQIIDAPAVKGERHDAVLLIELGISCAMGCGSMVGPVGVMNPSFAHAA